MKMPVIPKLVQKDAPVLLTAAEGYRLWSRTYDVDLNPLLALEHRVLGHKLESVEGKDFLDVACGTGRWMAIAARRGANVIGVDLSLEMLSIANEKPGLRGHIVHGDGRWLPFQDKCADLVMCSFSIGYMSRLGQLISELARVVRSGGTVLISDLHPSARQMGWRRGFRSGSRTFEIECNPYTAEQVLSEGRDAGLRMREILEPHVSEPERLMIQRAGKEQVFDEIARIPAVLIVEWERP